MKFPEKDYCLLKSEGVPEYTMGVTNSGGGNQTQLGVCFYRKKIIKMNKHLILHRDKYPNAYLSTFLHEIAHAQMPRENHNWRWKMAFNKLKMKYGLDENKVKAENKLFNEEVLGELRKKYAKQIWKCPMSDKLIYYKKIKKYPVHRYRCKTCKSVMEEVWRVKK